MFKMFLTVWEIMPLLHGQNILTNLTLNNFSNQKEIMMKVLDTNSIKIDGIAKIRAAQLKHTPNEEPTMCKKQCGKYPHAWRT